MNENLTKEELLKKLSETEEMFNNALLVGLSECDRLRKSITAGSILRSHVAKRNHVISMLRVELDNLKRKLNAAEEAIISASEKSSYKELHIRITNQRKELKRIGNFNNTYYSKYSYYLSKNLDLEKTLKEVLQVGLEECEKLRSKVAQLECELASSK